MNYPAAIPSKSPLEEQSGSPNLLRPVASTTPSGVVCFTGLASSSSQVVPRGDFEGTAASPALRLSRLRSSPNLRALIRETTLDVKDLVYPLFIKGKTGDPTPIPSMPGIFQIPLSHLASEAKELAELGIPAVLLFGIPSHKDARGSAASEPDGIIQEAIPRILEAAPGLVIMTDLCFCEYTDHGHCGILKEGKLDHEATLKELVKQAISHARAGAHVIAPSGMIDGAIAALREGLGGAGFSGIPLLSYAVKYHSSLYGPFRQAAEGAPQFGDRSTHQMDPANALEALREARLDVLEGADMLMVKPAHTYLDVIYRVKEAFPEVPLAAYHTSGEYAMIKSAAEKGWVEEKKAATEVLQAIKRAGADFIITYYAKAFAKERQRS